MNITALKQKSRRTKVPSATDPRAELRILCNQHRTLTRSAVATENMATDKKNRETGEAIPNRLPEDVKEQLLAQGKELRRRASLLETPMLRQLRQIPVYALWLKDVAGVGPVLSAYLVTMVDIAKATKPSALRRYVGLGITDGKRDVMSVEIRWNAELKMRLYLWAVMMRQNKTRAGTNKYLRRWEEAKHRCATVTNTDKAKGWIDAKGRRKAADLFIDDLYTVWRAIEGLPVWPTFRDVAATYGHAEKMVTNEPEALTVEQALARVGDCGWQPVEVATAAE